MAGFWHSYPENSDRKHRCCCRRNTSWKLRVCSREMAAHSTNFIRVRLHFDYPPPAVVDCRMCWLLVDLNKCRVVADLESIIREKFEFSRRSILNLFIEDCYLPHTESIYVVRDNDSVRCACFQCHVINAYLRSLLATLWWVRGCMWDSSSLSVNLTEETICDSLSSSFRTDKIRYFDKILLHSWSTYYPFPVLSTALIAFISRGMSRHF